MGVQMGFNPPLDPCIHMCPVYTPYLLSRLSALQVSILYETLKPAFKYMLGWSRCHGTVVTVFSNGLGQRSYHNVDVAG